MRTVARGIALVREVGIGAGYLGENARTLHFGLGSAAIVDSVEIRWPSGIRQLLRGVGVGQRMEVTESDLPLEVNPPTRAMSLSLVCRPNPFFGSVTLLYEPATSGRVDLEVYDPAGRRVRRLEGTVSGGPGTDGPGTHKALWDGRDETGRSVASGVYFFRLRTERGARCVRGTLLR